jgi:hypothetical protein
MTELGKIFEASAPYTAAIATYSLFKFLDKRASKPANDAIAS